MKDYKITQQEINQVVLHSPYSLSDSPASEGLKAVHIKKYFYDFIRVLAEKLNIHLGELTEVLSTYDGIYSDVSDNKSKIEEIVNKIIDLDTKDSELGTGIQNAVAAHNENTLAHLDIRKSVSEAISAHDQAPINHEDIRQKLKYALEKGELAYMVASGKSRAFPVESVADIFDLILSSEEIRIGDVFIIAEGDVSDITVFDIGVSEPAQSDIELLPEDVANAETELLPDKIYYYNGYRLLSSKKGIETSVLAKREELDGLASELYKYMTENDSALALINTSLENKQEKNTILENNAQSVDILNNTEYNLGLRTSISIVLPENTDGHFESYFNFRSGTTPTSIDSPDNLIFTGDDTLNGKLYPISSRIYEVSIKNVGGYLIARVGSADYEVIE